MVGFNFLTLNVMISLVIRAWKLNQQQIVIDRNANICNNFKHHKMTNETMLSGASVYGTIV